MCVDGLDDGADVEDGCCEDDGPASSVFSCERPDEETGKECYCSVNLGTLGLYAHIVRRGEGAHTTSLEQTGRVGANVGALFLIIAKVPLEALEGEDATDDTGIIGKQE